MNEDKFGEFICYENPSFNFKRPLKFIGERLRSWLDSELDVRSLSRKAPVVKEFSESDYWKKQDEQVQKLVQQEGIQEE